MAISLEHPWLLLTALAVLAPWLAHRLRPGGLSLPSLVLISAAVILLALALAQPTGTLKSNQQAQWLVLRDVSASVGGQHVELSWPAKVAHKTVRFADGLAGPGQSDPPDSATRLADALLLAGAQANDLAGVLILTDGRFVDEISAPANQLRQTRLPVRIVALQAPPADARIAALTWRKQGQQTSLQIDIASNADQKRTLEILDSRGKQIEAIDLRLLANVPVSLSRTVPPEQATGLVTVRLTPADAIAANDTASIRILSTRPRLVVLASEDQLPAWSAALAGAEMDIRTVQPGQSLALDDAAVVVLVDQAGDALTGPQRKTLARFVRTGGGLVLIGSGPRQSPADREDPLNAVLALLAQPYQRQSLDVTILLDASGSMSQRRQSPAGTGQQKFRLAADAVLSLQEHLTDRDRLSVVQFAETASLLYESGQKQIDFSALASALAKVQPDGATDVSPALQLAQRRLDATSQAPRDPLVILVTDLEVKPFDPSPAIAWFNASDRRKLAIVAIGGTDVPAGPDNLAELARQTAATYVPTGSVEGLGAIFADLLAELRGQGISNQAVQPIWGQDLWTVRAGPLPKLDATIPSVLADGAQPLAQVDWGTLMARRTVWLGRSVTLAAADVDTLPGDPKWSALLAGACRWVRPPANDPSVSGRLRLQAGTLTLTIDSTTKTDQPWVAQILESGQAGPVGIPLTRTGPRRWQLHKPQTAPTAHVVVRRGRRVVWSGSISSAMGAEWARIGPDWQNLSRLADLTDGRIIQPAQLGQYVAAAEKAKRQPLWPFAVVAALAIILAEWILSAHPLRRRL